MPSNAGPQAQLITLLRRWTWTGDFKCREVKTGFCRNRLMQTGSSGTLIGWKSGQTTFVPLWDWMEGAWLRTLTISCHCQNPWYCWFFTQNRGILPESGFSSTMPRVILHNCSMYICISRGFIWRPWGKREAKTAQKSATKCAKGPRYPKSSGLIYRLKLWTLASNFL